MRSSFGAVDGAVALARDAELARDRQPGELVVAGHHHRADAGAAAFGHRRLDLVARRVDLADQAEQPGAPGEAVEAGGRVQRVIVDRGEGQHAQRARRHRIGGRARGRAARPRRRRGTGAARPRARP